MVLTTYIESETIINSEGSLNHFKVSKTASASILLLVVPIFPLYSSLIISFCSLVIIEHQPPVLDEDLKLPSV
jgi:hypothetical protein